MAKEALEIEKNVKLQRIFAYSYGDKAHYKYQLTIPEDIVERMGWKAGGQLGLIGEPETNGKKGLLHILYHGDPKPKDKPIERQTQMDYETFKKKIITELRRNKNGLTWTEIRNKVGLPQKVPNNTWVRFLEKDVGLLRVKDMRGIVWRLV